MSERDDVHVGDIDKLRRGSTSPIGKRLDPSRNDTVPTEEMNHLREATALDEANLLRDRRIKLLERAIFGAPGQPGLLPMTTLQTERMGDVKETVHQILLAAYLMLGCIGAGVTAYITYSVRSAFKAAGDQWGIVAGAYLVLAVAFVVAARYATKVFMRAMESKKR